MADNVAGLPEVGVEGNVAEQVHAVHEDGARNEGGDVADVPEGNRNTDPQGQRRPGATRERRYQPEVPFRACDTLATVEVLRNKLEEKHVVGVPEAAGMNKNGRDCVFIALKYGTKATVGGVRKVKDTDTGANVDLNTLTILQLRCNLADHVKKVWDDPTKWARNAIKRHVLEEGKSFLQLHNATPTQVRDAYCDAIKGENGREEMYGDLGVMLAFTSKYSVVMMCFFPPRPTATVSATQLFRPLKFGTEAPGSRVACTLMMYVLDDGVGHAEPLRGVSATHVRQARFHGKINGRVTTVVCNERRPERMLNENVHSAEEKHGQSNSGVAIQDVQ